MSAGQSVENPLQNSGASHSSFAADRQTVVPLANRHPEQHGPSGSPGSPHCSAGSTTPLPHVEGLFGTHVQVPPTQTDRLGSHPSLK